MGVAELIAAGLSSDSSKVLQRAVAEFESDLQKNVLGKMPLSNSDFEGRFEAAISRGLTSLARSCVRLEHGGTDIAELKRCSRLFRARADDLQYWANQQNNMAKDELFNRINSVIAVAFDEVEVRFYERVVRKAATPLDPAAFDAAAADIIARARDGVISACLETMREHVRFLSDEGLEHLVRLFNERSDRALRTWHAHNKGRLARHKARMELAAAREKDAKLSDAGIYDSDSKGAMTDTERERAPEPPEHERPQSPPNTVSLIAPSAQLGRAFAAAAASASFAVDLSGPDASQDETPMDKISTPRKTITKARGTQRLPSPPKAPPPPSPPPPVPVPAFAIPPRMPSPPKLGGSPPRVVASVPTSPPKVLTSPPKRDLVPCELPPALPDASNVVELLDTPPPQRIKPSSASSSASSSPRTSPTRPLVAGTPGPSPAPAPPPPAPPAEPAPSPPPSAATLAKPRSTPVSPMAAAPLLARSAPAPAPWRPAGPRRAASAVPRPKGASGRPQPPRTSPQRPLVRHTSLVEMSPRQSNREVDVELHANSDEEVVLVLTPRPVERMRPGTREEERAGESFHGHDDGALSELSEAAAGAHQEPIVGTGPRAGTVDIARVGNLRGRRSQNETMRSWGSKFATEWILSDPKEGDADDSSDEEAARGEGEEGRCTRKRVCS